MTIRETKARSLLIKHRKIDSWFISRYGLNLYRGCAHNCVYCDGRSERYQVNDAFGENVVVKINAVEVLSRELDPKRRRVKLRPSYIMLGGGVGDSYQPAETQYKLTRKTLQLLTHYEWPVHILTKSTLVERDLDLIKQNHQRHGAIVSFSLSSTNDEISAIFEPHVTPPSERLNALARIKRKGITTGIFLLPVIPFLTDTPDMIENAFRKAREVEVDFIIFGGMTLKEGRQKDYFVNVLRDRYPQLVRNYANLYKGDVWGHANKNYYHSINSAISQIARKYQIPLRIPPRLYKDILCENDLVIVMLEHLDYFLQLDGKRSSFGSAANAISKIDEPLSRMKHELKNIKGVGEKTEQIILDILETKTSEYYDDLSY